MLAPSPAAGRSAVNRATLVGFTAILMWATLAPLATLASTVPPFQLVATSFLLAFLVGSGWTLARGGNPLRYFRQPAAAWALGVGGLFGFHFLYFMALQAAPPVEANLINYLWPLLIVLFSALLPGERLRWWHVAGALAGLAGTALLIARGGSGGFSVEAAHLPGYAAALGSAVTWAGYSVLRRRLGQVGEAPTDAVSAFCLVTALLSLLCHLMLERTVWPETAAGWTAMLLLGLGPVGAAFFVWDFGVRHGDIRALGALSYLAPLLSTLLLVLFGLAPNSGAVWAACALIAGGSLLASKDLLRRG
ncbi:aromatic amino acid exporter YddG [Azospirillum picis]|uniref:Drug/metabolite transporter (DMT)-like permease n=1 Tax=Azospirillum picis TaxID=488438 RepID=A0ABU0MDI2_9PROT|nr:EamA family transporter [Azospirillum picis]MBP2297663.1 drug/metabolite transporter (DMT)-like permease [Azospirillum picis]MDQ0531314.1 drug/metabolite transporter (DMT)-like permease [Azospirillum picis]